MGQLRKFTGGCHCGAVRFEVETDALVALECNCSICRKKGYLHLIVPQERFLLVSGGDSLTTYRFNTGVAQHRFCRDCGVHSFYIPRSHPQGVDVNVRCLDGDALSQFTVTPFDGENWEENVATIRGGNDGG